jgi:hypothetical protein
MTVGDDAGFLGTFTWNYCILDEGHVIKNAKSKTTQVGSVCGLGVGAPGM